MKCGKAEKQKVLDRYDNIRKEKPAEKYTGITFAASYRNTEASNINFKVCLDDNIVLN